MKTQTDPSLFRLGSRPKVHENMIASLVNQYYCVGLDTRIRDLSDELKRIPDVWAVGVVNGKNEAVGIIVTTQFQERLSRPFAHDILDKKPVTELMTVTRVFDYDKNILTVSDDLADEVRRTSNHYFLVQDSKGCFCGIFSTKDLLIHQFSAHREDLELAVSIQRSVVPEHIQQATDRVEIYASSNMAKGVGGDFLSVRETAPGRWLLSVCDVSGKGVAASLVTASLGGLFATYDEKSGLDQFVSRINTYILKTFQMEKYLTGVFLDFDEASRKVRACDMGHSYFGMVRQGAILKTQALNPFVGFVPDLAVQTLELDLQPGDLLFVYTDGYVEQKNIHGDEFGIDTFETALLENSMLPLDELAQLLHHKVKKFRGDQPRGDDEAVLLVRMLSWS